MGLCCQWEGDTMDQTTSVILSVEAPRYKEVVIQASDGYKYTSDLSRFASVYCFPKDQQEWEKVFIDSEGRSLIWSSRFEVHIDQILANVVSKEVTTSSGLEMSS